MLYLIQLSWKCLTRFYRSLKVTGRGRNKFKKVTGRGKNKFRKREVNL